MTRNLTTGSPMRLILQFAVPTLLGLLFQQYYNLVDTMIVGKLLGAQALAAVGSTGSINFGVIGFCTGSNLHIFFRKFANVSLIIRLTTGADLCQLTM